MKKIDLVYTWVNGNDKEWQEKKNKYQQVAMEKIATNNCRYRDNDELKYSLRSVEKYAPWINHIYIVTDNQVPEWLNVSHEKISIVDHKDILPSDALPTFNSNSILHNIVNIPNLSEYFLYADDDMFFVNNVTSDFFFRNNKPICRFKYSIDKTTTNSQYIKMIKKTVSIMHSKNFIFPEQLMHHNIDSYKKSTIFECQNIFKKELRDTIYAKFRRSDDIERSLYSYYAIATNQGIHKIIHKIDSDLPIYKRILNYLNKNYAVDSKYFGVNTENIENELKLLKPKLICINDNENSSELTLTYASEFLQKYFVQKSSFEK